MGNTPEKELKISIGDIFTDDENYPKRAEWCNTNGCRIVELTPDKEGRRFEIVKIPQKDLDTAKAEKIAETPETGLDFFDARGYCIVRDCQKSH